MKNNPLTNKGNMNTNMNTQNTGMKMTVNQIKRRYRNFTRNPLTKLLMIALFALFTACGSGSGGGGSGKDTSVNLKISAAPKAYYLSRSDGGKNKFCALGDETPDTNKRLDGLLCVLVNVENDSSRNVVNATFLLVAGENNALLGKVGTSESLYELGRTLLPIRDNSSDHSCQPYKDASYDNSAKTYEKCRLGSLALKRRIRRNTINQCSDSVSEMQKHIGPGFKQKKNPDNEFIGWGSLPMSFTMALNRAKDKNTSFGEVEIVHRYDYSKKDKTERKYVLLYQVEGKPIRRSEQSFTPPYPASGLVVSTGKQYKQYVTPMMHGKNPKYNNIYAWDPVARFDNVSRNSETEFIYFKRTDSVLSQETTVVPKYQNEFGVLLLPVRYWDETNDKPVSILIDSSDDIGYDKPYELFQYTLIKLPPESELKGDNWMDKFTDTSLPVSTNAHTKAVTQVFWGHRTCTYDASTDTEFFTISDESVKTSTSCSSGGANLVTTAYEPVGGHESPQYEWCKAGKP